MKMSVLILLSLLTSICGEAIACDCVSLVGYDEAKIVFIGKVLDVTDVGPNKITFKVYRFKKGRKRSKEITIYTPCSSVACCGIDFQKDEVYKVYAYEENGELHTDDCTATHKLKK